MDHCQSRQRPGDFALALVIASVAGWIAAGAASGADLTSASFRSRGGHVVAGGSAALSGPGLSAGGSVGQSEALGPSGATMSLATQAGGFWPIVRGGIASLDLDGDGDLDIIGYGLAGDDNQRQVKLYRNDLPKKNWIRVRPVGAPGNINAAGSKIRIYRAGQTENALWDEQVQIVSSQSAQSYYAFALTERHFGLDTLPAVDVMVVFYPSGRTVTLQHVKANATIEVHEPLR